MTAILTSAELRNMQVSDLAREMKEQSVSVAKLRLGITIKKEKDTAKYRRAKRQLALMQTVMTEKKKQAEASTSSPKES